MNVGTFRVFYTDDFRFRLCFPVFKVCVIRLFLSTFSNVDFGFNVWVFIGICGKVISDCRRTRVV